MADVSQLIGDFLDETRTDPEGFTDDDMHAYLTAHGVEDVDATFAVEDWGRHQLGAPAPEQVEAMRTALGVPPDWRDCTREQLLAVGACPRGVRRAGRRASPREPGHQAPRGRDA